MDREIPSTHPLMPWTGGKQWALKSPEVWGKICDLFEAIPNNSGAPVFCSPFLGAGAIELALSDIYGAKGIVADVNTWLINAWQNVHLIEGMSWQCEQYLEVRETFNLGIAKWQIASMPLQLGIAEELTEAFWAGQAQRYVWLVKNGVNGLSRFDKTNGKFNVSPGTDSKGNPKNPSPHPDLNRLSRLSKRWAFSTSSYEQSIPLAATALSGAKEALLILDPPYDPLPGKKSFTSYYGGKFDWWSQMQLLKLANEWAGPVVAFNHATDRIVQMYEGSGFIVEKISRTHSMGSDSNRPQHLEMFAYKGYQGRNIKDG